MSRQEQEKTKDLSDIDRSSSDMEEILLPLCENIGNISLLLNQLQGKFEAKFKQQESKLQNLRTRVKSLEARTEFIYHMAELNAHKIDDGEQF